MAEVHIPLALRPLTNGAPKVDADGQKLGEIFDALEKQFPGIRARLCNGEELRRFVRLAVNNDIVFDKFWFDFRVCPNDTVTIVTAIAGG